MRKRKIIHAFLRSLSSPARYVGVVSYFEKRPLESVIVPGWYENSRLPVVENRSVRPRIGRDNGHPESHRFDKGMGKSFVARIEYEDIGRLNPSECLGTRKSRSNERTPIFILVFFYDALDRLKTFPWNPPACRNNEELSILLP